MALKDGTTFKKHVAPGLDVPLDLVKNKATAAAGFQNVPLATPKHHGPEQRNDLQINRKNKFPGGRNVPSEILLEILSNPAILLSLILLSC